MRLRIEMRLTVNQPLLFFPQMCVKPRKSNVSGLPSPLRFRFSSANRLNSIRRFIWVEFQTELAQTLPQRHQEAICIRLVLETQDGIVPRHFER
jgi:hypothetical protein